MTALREIMTEDVLTVEPSDTTMILRPWVLSAAAIPSSYFVPRTFATQNPEYAPDRQARHGFPRFLGRAADPNS